jgi:hypothetical protein
MSLLDKIRQESEEPTITVSPRTDPLVRSLQIVENTAVPSGDETLEQSLAAELSALPKISEKKVGVRLQQEILAELEALCRQNDITMETLLESFYVVCSPQDKVMSKVLTEAQRRIKQRVRAGNIRSILTKTRNLKAVK